MTFKEKLAKLEAALVDGVMQAIQAATLEELRSPAWMRATRRRNSKPVVAFFKPAKAFEQSVPKLKAAMRTRRKISPAVVAMAKRHIEGGKSRRATAKAMGLPISSLLNALRRA